MGLSHEECDGALIREQGRLESALKWAALSPMPIPADFLVSLYQQAGQIRVCMECVRKEFPHAR